jgi:hypothetical protein
MGYGSTCARPVDRIRPSQPAGGGRNAPTVFNAAGQIAQFWNELAADVEEQAKERRVATHATHVYSIVRSTWPATR